MWWLLCQRLYFNREHFQEKGTVSAVVIAHVKDKMGEMPADGLEGVGCASVELREKLGVPFVFESRRLTQPLESLCLCTYSRHIHKLIHVLTELLQSLPHMCARL